MSYYYDKRETFKKYLSTGTLEDQIEYKRRRATAKKTVRKNKRETWNNFVSKLENDTRLYMNNKLITH
jgi:hypothetical protein